VLSQRTVRQQLPLPEIDVRKAAFLRLTSGSKSSDGLATPLSSCSTAASSSQVVSRLYTSSNPDDCDGDWDNQLANSPSLGLAFEPWLEAFRAGLLRLKDVGHMGLSECSDREFESAVRRALLMVRKAVYTTPFCRGLEGVALQSFEGLCELILAERPAWLRVIMQGLDHDSTGGLRRSASMKSDASEMTRAWSMSGSVRGLAAGLRLASMSREERWRRVDELVSMHQVLSEEAYARVQELVVEAASLVDAVTHSECSIPSMPRQAASYSRQIQAPLVLSSVAHPKMRDFKAIARPPSGRGWSEQQWLIWEAQNAERAQWLAKERTFQRARFDS